MAKQRRASLDRFLSGAMAYCAVLMVACAPPDRPAALLTKALLDLVEPDTIRSIRVTEGVRYHFLWSGEGPWAIHLLRADLRRCELGVEVLRGSEPPSTGPGLATVTEMLLRGGGTYLAGVNGDFFTPEGWPVGTEVSDGTVRRARARPAFSWEPGRDPWIGRVEPIGDAIYAGRWVPMEGASGEIEVVSGFPELLDDGMPVGEAETGGSAFATTRHPRTAVAFVPRDGSLWLAVVDGRQGAYSSGMTLDELTRVLEAVGATEAINLDGGGSSVMVVEGRRMSRPSDADGERAVANALALELDPTRCGT